MSKEKKNEKINEQEKPVENKPEEGSQDTTPAVQEIKKTFIDRQYEKYCEKRKAKAEKKAAKKPMSKAKKTGLVVGGLALAGALASGMTKALLTANANNQYCDDENANDCEGPCEPQVDTTVPLDEIDQNA